MGEQTNTDVVTDDNIDDGNFEPNAANNDLNKEWGLKDFVPDEETKDELWDREDEVFSDAELTKHLSRQPRKRRIQSIDANRISYRCSPATSKVITGALA